MKLFSIDEIAFTTDYVANGSFASLRENVKYSYSPDYAILVRSTDANKDWKGDFVYVSKSAYQFLSKSSLIPGDIIITNVGNPGEVFIVPDLGKPMTIGPNAILVRPDSDIVDRNYLAYFLNSPHGNKLIQSIVTATAQRKFNKTSFRKLKIPLPSIASQRRIAEILDKADEIIRKRKSAIELTEQLLKSTFLDMFGDPITNPKGWEIKPLKNFGKILTGNTPPRADTDNYGDHIEWIKSDNITIPEHFLSQATEKLSAKGKKLGRVVPKNSILVTCIAGSKSSIGRAGLADREVAFNQQINAIIPNKETNPFFLYGHFFAFQNLVQEKSTDSMKGMVNKTEFSNIEFMKPPKQNQDKFGDFFCNFHRYYKSLKIQLQESENLFNSLLQRAFKGEL